jgi:hypothetical protein
MMTEKWRNLAFGRVSKKNQIIIIVNSHAGRVAVRANTPRRGSISDPVAPTFFDST